MKSSVIAIVLCAAALVTVVAAGREVLVRSVRAARPQFFSPYINVPSWNPAQATFGLTIPGSYQKPVAAAPVAPAPVAPAPQPSSVQPSTQAPTVEGLNSRFDGPAETTEDNPCQHYDPAQAPPADGVSEDPCAGIGGNKISPKQAALLSLVG